MKEWVEIVRVRPQEPVEEDYCATTRNAGKNLKRRVGWGVCACLSAHNEDAAIGQNKCGRIPTSTLYGKLVEHRYCNRDMEVVLYAYL
jgi:hypothetical protein